MMKYYSADYILPISFPKIKEGVVAFDEEGSVAGLYCADDERLQDKEVTRYDGVLIPGFINTHCHLELSHMMGTIPQKTGLPAFLSTVMSMRQSDENIIQERMVQADDMMFRNGIQAVGDHVNTGFSAKIKGQSPIHYRTFVELLGMAEDGVCDKINQAKELSKYFETACSSVTPHAPYSCSKTLLKELARSITEHNALSIHNQESEEENKLFRYKKGAFLDFYKNNHIPYEHFKASGKDSLQTYIPWLPKKNRLILVHNTFTTIRDIDYLQRVGREVYFCLCPKANLYIEGKLPSIDAFVQYKQALAIGTDSLASNDTLDVLEELKTIHNAYPALDLETTLVWATLNGAKALGMEHFLGSLDIGKKPGLLLLEGLESLQIRDGTKVKRII